MSDILFIKTSSLGDVIHYLPAITEARRNHPQARFSWVVEEAFVPIARLHPAAGTVLAVASRRWRTQPHRLSMWRELATFGSTLRAQSYDEIVDAQGLLRTAVIAKAARGRRHGYDAVSVRERAASCFYDVRHRVDRGLHAIARNRALTGLALGYAPDGAPDFGLDRGRLTGATAAPRAVLLHATARPVKEWPEAFWIDAGRMLAGRGIELVLPWGTGAERDRSLRLAAAIGAGTRVPDRQPLEALAAQIAGAALVVGVDTGLLHLAAAFGVPLVGIFVGSEPELTGPMGAGPIAVVGGNGAMPSVSEVMMALARIGIAVA